MTGPAIEAMFHFVLPMAIDTPWHSQRRNSRDAVHSLYRSMAFLTFDVCPYVALVCEVDEIGDVVDFDPRNRLTIFPVGDQLEDIRLLAHIWKGPVTSHALADAGDAGDRRRSSIDMTVLARDLVFRCMHRVTECDWLDRGAIRKIFAVHPYAYQ